MSGEVAGERAGDGPEQSGAAPGFVFGPEPSRAAPGFVFGPAPRDDGLVYPGAHPPFSFLLVGNEIERLDGVDEHGFDDDDQLAGRLRALGAAPMARRQPVLAYGSNRSPAQLVSKFGSGEVEPVIPVVRAELVGQSVVFSAAAAWYGSIPAALVVDRGATTEVAVTFLDDEQLAIMDETEGGHGRRELDHAHHPLRLLSGDLLAPCQWYRSTRPVLTWDGLPIRLREIGSEGSELPARTQRELQAMLLELWRAGGEPFADVQAFGAAVRSDVVRSRVNASLLALVDAPVGRLGARPVP
jgi:hypothetical protein